MRKTLGVCSLVLLLTYSARAGIIQNEAPAPPPPTNTQESDGGDMPNGIMPNDATVTLTQAALELLAVLL